MFATRDAAGRVIARPRMVIVNCAVWTVVLVGASLLGWFALPADIRVLFTAPQVGTLLFFVAFMVAFMWTVGLSYVRADAVGLKFRNGLRSHARTWDQVEGIRYASGDPWAFVELDGDPDRLALLGIMRTDGRRAEALVHDLRRLHAANRH